MTEILLRAVTIVAVGAVIWFGMLFLVNGAVLWAEMWKSKRLQTVDVYRCWICRTEHRVMGEYRDRMQGARCPECDVELTRIFSRSW